MNNHQLFDYLNVKILWSAGSEAMFADLGHFSKKSIKVLNIVYFHSYLSSVEGVLQTVMKIVFLEFPLQMTFVSVIYPILILCYAGQAAFISKHLNASDELIHLSTSMPGKSDTCFTCVFQMLLPRISFGNSWKEYGKSRIFPPYLCSIVSNCFSRRKPSYHNSQFLHHKPVPCS